MTEDDVVDVADVTSASKIQNSSLTASHIY